MKHRRKIKLILPGLQLRLIAAFLCLAVLALILQYILLVNALAGAASALPNDGVLLLDQVGPMLLRVFAFTAVVILPLTYCVGLLVTHRFAGPLYRFHVYLRQVIAGERPPECQLRKGDQLQELCTLINEATAPVRAKSQAPRQVPPATPGLRAAG